VEYRVLMVCTMNVCRSPLMAAAFSAALPSAERAAWVVRSQGVAAVDGASMCAVAARTAGVDPSDHHARSVVVPQLETYDLIVTASRAERGVLATVSAATRSRTFTLGELLALDDALRADSAAAPASVREWARALHAHRGLVAPERPGFLGRFRAENLWEIPDVHGSSRRRHAVVLRGAVREASRLADRARSAVGAHSLGLDL
jgi:protein-tyrosine phosphatase